MADAVEQIRFKNKQALPDELKDYDGLGRDEKNRLALFDEGGNPVKGVRDVGDLLMKTLINLNHAEELDSSDEKNDFARLNQRINELEKQLKKAEKRGAKPDDDKEDPDLDARIQRIVDEQTKDLREKLARYEEGVDGFRIGDSVGWATEEGNYDSYDLGYIVVGYTDEGKINIKDLESGDIAYDIEPSELEHEDELDKDEEKSLQFDDKVGVKENGKYRKGYTVISKNEKNGKFIVKNEVGILEEYDESNLKNEDDINDDEVLDDKAEPEYADGAELVHKRGDKWEEGYTYYFTAKRRNSVKMKSSSAKTSMTQKSSRKMKNSRA
jgi:hypothetical protein